ncbi:MAG: c-type cytochrome [Terriglobales bacterium]
MLWQSLPAQSRFWRRFFLFLSAALSLFAGITLILVSYGSTPAMSQTSNAHAKAQRPIQTAASSSEIARGKYLVEDVARCGQCHTPHDANGNPDRSRWLQGAPIQWMPVNHDPNWPLSAPRIGGTPPADDADMIRLLTTGIWTNGNHLRAPMPQFRMDRSDAEAVVAYLKSLPPSP